MLPRVPVGRHETHQGKDSSLSFFVGTHYEDEVLDANDEDERIHHQTGYAIEIRRGVVAQVRYHGWIGIDWTRTEISIYHSNAVNRQQQKLERLPKPMVSQLSREKLREAFEENELSHRLRQTTTNK